MRKTILFLSLSFSILANAQDVKAPKLKDSVEANIRTIEYKLTQTRLTMANYREEYGKLQVQESGYAGALTATLKTALKDSDIDDTKYDLNPETLVITEKVSEKSPDKATDKK